MRAQVPDLRRTSTKAALIFLAPTVVVAAASWWYYGYPLPNTAVAKLTSSISVVERIQYGVAYWRDSFVYFDPVPVALLAASAAMALVVRSGRALAWAGGGMMHAAYVVWIGGDFMAGRFTHTAMLLSICGLGFALAEIPRHPARRLFERAVRCGAMVSFAGVLVWGGVGAWAMVSSGAEFRNAKFFGSGLLADEKGFYARYHHWSNFLPLLVASEQVRWVRSKDFSDAASPLVLCGNLGAAGMFFGPRVHIIDLCGLSDAFLARLPPVKSAEWRAGHDVRLLPEGYYESILEGRNRLVDPSLRSLLDTVWLGIRANLTEPERIHAASDLWRRQASANREAEEAWDRMLVARSLALAGRAREDIVQSNRVSIQGRDPASVIRLSLTPVR